MKHLLLVALVGLCNLASGQTIVTDSVRIDNHYRSFHYYQPGNLKNPSLLFVLHGSRSNGKAIMKSATQLQEIAAKENLLLVYPDAYQQFWNECRTASPAAANKENINEEAFFTDMIAYFQRKFSTDKNNVFVVGTSGGGHMAYKLALTIPEKFKAITAIIANLPDASNFDCVAVNKPIPVMIINGTEDVVNPYNGGEVNIGISLGRVRSTNDTFMYWANLAGHKGEPVKEAVADKDPADGKTIERFTFSAKGKQEVVLLKVIGGKHDYPNDIDVYLEAWQFFKRQIK